MANNDAIENYKKLSEGSDLDNFLKDYVNN